MMKKLPFLAFVLLSTFPLAAQNWSVGVGAGPFVFGDFLERRVRIGTGEGTTGVTTLVLSPLRGRGRWSIWSAAINDRWAVRLEGSFTNAPLRLEQSGANGNGSDLDSGDLDVSTFVLPVVFRINRSGAFRFHVMAGPALALYRGDAPGGVSSQPLFEGTQNQWGLAYGAARRLVAQRPSRHRRQSHRHHHQLPIRRGRLLLHRPGRHPPSPQPSTRLWACGGGSRGS